MNNLNWSFRTATKRCLSLARNRDSLENVDIFIVSVVILGIWLTGVILTTTTHEFWRDEVRALTSARSAVSPLHLFELIRDGGHPALWYLLLYLCSSITNTPAVLPIVSIVIAFSAVATFMLFSPFSLLRVSRGTGSFWDPELSAPSITGCASS